MASLIVLRAKLAKAVADGNEVMIRKLQKEINAETLRRAKKKGKK